MDKLTKILSHPIVRTFLLLAAVYLAVILGSSLLLRGYTFHGQKIEIPDFTDLSIEEARDIAKEHNFKIVVEDSLFIVGREGGFILEQNPKAGSFVKQNRKVYTTATKQTADRFKVAQLSDLYGKNFEQKQRELAAAFEIECKIKGYEYDQGKPDHILRVLYDGDEIINSNGRKNETMIEKGATLEFILSKSTEGSLFMPDVKCQTLEEARFYLQGLSLVVGEIVELDEVSNLNKSYVSNQRPSANMNILTGDTVVLFVTSYPPVDCE